MHKRRTVAVRPQSRQNAEINVTPLVDVVLVLLIIFMVVTPLLEKEISVQVPATETVEDVSDLPPDQLVVHLDDKGEVKLNSEVVAADAFLGHLKDILEHRGDKTVFFQSDEGASYGTLVQLLDLARRAGATKLGMATEAPDKPEP